MGCHCYYKSARETYLEASYQPLACSYFWYQHSMVA